MLVLNFYLLKRLKNAADSCDNYGTCVHYRKDGSVNILAEEQCVLFLHKIVLESRAVI